MLDKPSKKINLPVHYTTCFLLLGGVFYSFIKLQQHMTPGTYKNPFYYLLWMNLLVTLWVGYHNSCKNGVDAGR